MTLPSKSEHFIQYPVGPTAIQDPQLSRLVQIVVIQIATAQRPMEAIHLCTTFTASGSFPDHVQHNPCTAFHNFEQAMRAWQGWFRLGCDYENFGDSTHALNCFV